MKIIGCDFHPSYQQIAMLDRETGEWSEGKLVHAGGEAPCNRNCKNAGEGKINPFTLAPECRPNVLDRVDSFIDRMTNLTGVCCAERHS